MRGGRPAHVLRAEDQALGLVLLDSAATDEQRAAALLAWVPPTDAEELAVESGLALEAWCGAFGIELPVVPSWLRELAGITERARYMLAALIEVADPMECVSAPVARLQRRFELPMTDACVASLAELRDVRLIRGNGKRVVLTRRLR